MGEHISLRKPCERSLGITAQFCFDEVAEDSYYEIRCKCNDFRNKLGCPFNSHQSSLTDSLCCPEK